MRIDYDCSVGFPAIFVRGGSKTEQRRLSAEYARVWMENQYALGYKGCVVFDIDDTLIDFQEGQRCGFAFMKDVYDCAFLLYPVHIVTARPDEDRRSCLEMLAKRGICIPPDRLHMLPTHQYHAAGNHTYVEQFKWKCHLDFVEKHGMVVARFGDKLWDVAHLKSLTTYLRHVEDKDTYIFFDPALDGTLSVKLPGLK